MVRMAFRTSHGALPCNGWKGFTSLSTQLANTIGFEGEMGTNCSSRSNFHLSLLILALSDLVPERRRSRAGAGQTRKMTSNLERNAPRTQ